MNNSSVQLPQQAHLAPEIPLQPMHPPTVAGAAGVPVTAHVAPHEAPLPAGQNHGFGSNICRAVLDRMNGPTVAGVIVGTVGAGTALGEGVKLMHGQTDDAGGVYLGGALAIAGVGVMIAGQVWEKNRARSERTPQPV